MKKHIITIAGFPGSGKSNTAKGVARVLGYDHFSSGDLFRSMAVERGLSVEEMNVAAETQKEIDEAVDGALVKAGRERDNLVIDSRNAFHWIPDSFKVFLDLDPNVAAERIFSDIQKQGRVSQKGASVKEVYENMTERMKNEIARYKRLYDIDIADRTQFDLVINTGDHGLQEVIDTVVREYRAWIGE